MALAMRVFVVKLKGNESQKIFCLCVVCLLLWESWKWHPRHSDAETSRCSTNVTGPGFIWNSSFCAVICEPRPLAKLIPVVGIVSILLPFDWTIMIFHSSWNKHLVTKLARGFPPGKLVLNENYFGSAQNADANRYLTDKRVWEIVPTEKILLFQLDSILCSGSPYNVGDFASYDWIGAPWPHLKELGSGNGGLSLRSRTCMLNSIGNFTRRDPEDVFYSKSMRQLGCRVAPIEVAARFSVEGWFLDHAPLGLHKAYRYLSPLDFSILKKSCPEATILLD